ncbi:hypothetical protein LCGC14_2169710 [marine sediment metagenome]|uniref:Uncharacterized protein n=1 Tax=marine sediment metagenome TaxID=412755 RepID=A0A0F9DQK2_9ZZZZ
MSEAVTPLLLPTSDVPTEVVTAQTLIPFRRDDDRSKYLGYLCCGFSFEEALFVLGLNMTWLNVARQDSRFTDLELRIPELRKELSREYTELDFYRNFRMVLEKDHRVLRTSLGMDTDPETGEPAELSQYDQQYLLRLRSVYTPQQLQLLAIANAGAEGFDFSKWVYEHADVVQMSKTETLTVKKADG